MKKSNLINLLLVVVFLVGLSLLLYPSISDYWNSFTQSRVVTDYVQQVEQLDNELYKQMLAECLEYNASILEKSNIYKLSEEEQATYESLLNLSGTGIMAYIEIPKIKVSLPIYHGAEESVLQVGAGHLEWTSLPVGGESSHAVISSHRGLPSAKLFTDLDQLTVGDTFLVHVLDETLTYEVDQILIVLPYEVKDLSIIQGQDLFTLVTCTPYGINTHRLLVRGHRIDNIEEAKTIRVTADAFQIEPILVAPVVAAPILLILLFVLLITTRKRK